MKWRKNDPSDRFWTIDCTAFARFIQRLAASDHRTVSDSARNAVEPDVEPLGAPASDQCVCPAAVYSLISVPSLMLFIVYFSIALERLLSMLSAAVSPLELWPFDYCESAFLYWTSRPLFPAQMWRCNNRSSWQMKILWLNSTYLCACGHLH